MKLLIEVEFPNHAGNAMVKSGQIERVQGILQEHKAEAPHFMAKNGHRFLQYFVDVTDAAKLPFYAEPWWLIAEGKVTATVVMAAQDFGKAQPDIQAAAKKYG